MNRNHHPGWDYFMPDPGIVDKMHCRVCEEEMQVQRNVDGATSFAESLGKYKHLHDVFSCKNFDQDWHIQVIKLEEFKRTLPSATLRSLISEEIAMIKYKREATLEVLPLW